MFPQKPVREMVNTLRVVYILKAAIDKARVVGKGQIM